MPLNPVTTVLFAVFLFVGLAIVWYGARDLRVVYHVLRNDPVDVYTLPNHPGPVEIEGTAREGDDGTVTAPFSGRSCLAYEYEVQELRSSGKHSNWETLVEGGQAVPFFLDDGDARVRVEPAGASLHFGDHVTKVDPGDEPPERIRRFVDATDDVEAQDSALDFGPLELHLGNQQKFVERRLDVGETAYVYGEAFDEPVGGWGSGVVNAVVRRGERTPVFVISDAPERATAWRIVKGAVVTVGFGALFLGFVALFGVGML
ncbi:E3 ubiquitin ligase family protein [Halobacteria archaeon HArc-gm2]|nr:E3 ubiquitin ligase family protein [Halobacteria archaeon HArc-gm2]